jgi:capsular exopolysaccharide synthesis family protein
MLAAIIGVLLGLAVAVLLERLDDSIKSPDEVQEQLNLPMLGLIPAIKPGDTGGAPRDGTALNRLATHADPRSPVAESYRSLRTNLAFTRARTELRTLMLTSPGPADGKSTTVANLAITFAQQGQRTLLVDGDLRRAVIDKTFATPRSPGLTDVLVSNVPLSTAVVATEVPNLFVLPSGQLPPNPSELLGSPRMREVIADARSEFDMVLFDSPPLLAVTDAAVLSSMIDGVVLIIRNQKTARAGAARALAQLRAVRAPVLGAVLNDVRAGGGYYGGYGYYYYAYYGSEANGNGASRPARLMERLRRVTGQRS